MLGVFDSRVVPFSTPPRSDYSGRTSGRCWRAQLRRQDQIGSALFLHPWGPYEGSGSPARQLLEEAGSTPMPGSPLPR